MDHACRVGKICCTLCTILFNIHIVVSDENLMTNHVNGDPHQLKKHTNFNVFEQR